MRAHLESRRVDLVGREHEQARVAALLGGSRGGGGQVVLLDGAPGTGKSALLEYAAASAAGQGSTVLSTAGEPSERHLPHAALHSLLRPRLALLAELPAAEQAVLREAFGGTAPPPPLALARAALRLLAVVPEPVLLCVDDLDVLDTASRAAVHEMTRLCAGTRVSMIVAGRSARTAGTAPEAHTVELGPLSEVHARELVDRAGRVTGYAERELVLALAEGNPLALAELSLSGGLGDTAAFGMLPATPRLAEAYEEHLEGLSAAARDVLLVAALSTSPLVRDIVAAGADLLGRADAARAGLAEAAGRGLVVDEHGRLRFPLPLLRPAVVRLGSGASRLTAHAALGRTVESPAHAAWHAAQCAAGPDEELARRVETLAAGPCSGTGVLVVLAALECAARVSGDPERRADRLLRAAEAACEHGLPDQSLGYARRVDPAELGAFGRAVLLWMHELLPDSHTVGRERITELCEAATGVAAKDPAMARKLLHAAARRCYWQEAGAEERDLVRRTLEALETQESQGTQGTRESLGTWPGDERDLAVRALIEPLSVPWPLRPGTGPQPEGLEGPEAPEGPAEQILLGHVAHLTGDFARSAALFGLAEPSVRAEGHYGRLPHLLVPGAMGQIWLGTRWQAAQAMAEEGHQVAAGTGQPQWAARARGVQSVLEALRGRHDAALAYAAEAEESCRRLGQSRQLALVTLARALTASGTGRYADAYVQLRNLFPEPAGPLTFEQFLGLAFLAEAAAPAGETADAEAVVEHVDALTRTATPSPLRRKILAYAGAVLALDEEAEARYMRALEPTAETWPLLRGMALFGYGAWLRRRRRVTESREPLARAEAVFRALGALPRAELAASELRAAGQGSAEPEGDDLAQVLSPQQVTIARLAARGLTNRAIGEQLRLSPRTVASHLYQIFPRLNVTSRVQLAERLGAD